MLVLETTCTLAHVMAKLRHSLACRQAFGSLGAGRVRIDLDGQSLSTAKNSHLKYKSQQTMLTNWSLGNP